jgi:hypothetical protein
VAFFAVGGGIAAVGAIGGALISANASRQASQQQAQAAQRGQNLEYAMYQQNRADTQIYRNAAANAIPALEAQAAQPFQYTPYQPGQFQAPTLQDMMLDPGYNFRVSEGMKAINRSATAAGMGLSGTQMKAAQGFGQDMASQEYQNIFNRSLQGFQVNELAREFGAQQNYNMALGARRQQVGEYQTLAGYGTGTQAQMTAATANMGANLANLQGQYGNALASGTMGQANAYQGIFGGIGQAANQYATMRMYQNMLSRMPAYGSSTGQPYGYGGQYPDVVGNVNP